MKLNKFLLACMAGLCCFATACSDSDEDPCDPSMTVIKATDAIEKVASEATIDATTGAGCKEFAAALKGVTDTYDADSFKNTKDELMQGGAACTTVKSLLLADKILSEATSGKNVYSSVKEKMDLCTEVIKAHIGEGETPDADSQGILETFTTVDGWHTILQSAANATAGK